MHRLRRIRVAAYDSGCRQRQAKASSKGEPDRRHPERDARAAAGARTTRSVAVAAGSAGAVFVFLAHELSCCFLVNQTDSQAALLRSRDGSLLQLHSSSLALSSIPRGILHAAARHRGLRAPRHGHALRELQRPRAACAPRGARHRERGRRPRGGLRRRRDELVHVRPGGRRRGPRLRRVRARANDRAPRDRHAFYFLASRTPISVLRPRLPAG